MRKILLVVFVLLSLRAYAEAPSELLGTFGDWSAYRMKEKGAKVCFMTSTPQKMEGKYKKRGDVFFVISHRPQQKSFNVVNVIAGYNYKKGSSATLQIDKNKPVSLFTHEDGAWAKNEADDAKLVRLMRQGNKAIVKGKSSRGTLTTDIFSLKGFTRASRAIDKACGKK